LEEFFKIKEKIPVNVRLWWTMKFYEEIPGLAKFEDNLLNQINNQEAIIDTLKGRLEAKDKQASSRLRITF
jgi:hypothetical protein